MKTVIKAIYDANPTQKWDEWRVVNAVKVYGYSLSIQTSSGHYCSPRETLDNLEDYTSMEMAISNGDGRYKILEDECLKAWLGYGELISKGDGVGSEDDGYFPVYGWVSVDLINSLYLYLRKLELFNNNI